MEKKVITYPGMTKFLFVTLILLAFSCNILLAQNFTDSFIDLEGSSGGTVKWVDVNGDDYLDIFISGSNSGSKNAFCTIYLNQAGTHFTNSKLYFPPVNYGSADWGDYDNDGDPDLLLIGMVDQLQGSVICKIYKNNMPEGFTPVDFGFKGVFNGTANWIDFDNDGDLDIFTTGLDLYNQVSANFYENKDGVFYEKSISITPAYGGSVTVCDVDKDQDMDIILSGKRTINSTNSINTKVYLNNSKNGFKEVDLGLLGVYNSYLSWGDYDSDGNSDILLTGLSQDPDSENSPTSVTKIYRNQGGLNFSPVESQIVGIHKGIGVWGDCDNDGKNDILISGGVLNDIYTSMNRTTKVYLNRSLSFTEITNAPFLSLTNTSGAWGDYDNDNDLDVIIAGLDNKSNDVTRVYINHSDYPNSIPVEPKGLTTSIDNGSDSMIRIQWLPGFDNNSSPKSLTYNLRVGTTPDGCEIMAPNANVQTGFVKMPVRGNVDNNTSWWLKNLPPGTYYWSVQSIDNSFSGSPFTPTQSFIVKQSVGIAQISSVPEKFALQQNYPNPFNPSTKIRYSLPGNTNVKLSIFNSLGQKIDELLNQDLSAGTYEAVWNAKTSSGEALSSGIYFYTIETKFGIESRKMLLIK